MRVAGRAHVAAAALAALFALASYLRAASPYVSTGDTAEMQTVPYILGIAHPTGFPLFTLVGWAFTHLAPHGTVAWRTNALCGVCAAAAAGGVALLAGALAAGPLESFLAALLFAFSPAVWSKGSHADVHAMALALGVFALFFAAAYLRFGGARFAVAAALAVGFGLATHPVALWTIPALAAALLLRRELRRAELLRVAGAVVLPLGLYAYLPLRSWSVALMHLDPAAEAPVFGLGSAVWDTNHPRTWSGFLDEVTGRQFNASGSLLGAFDVRAYPGAFAQWSAFVHGQFAWFALALAALGVVALALRARGALVVLLAGTFGAVPFVWAYRYVEGDSARYYLLSLALLAVLAAASAGLPAGPRLVRSAVVSLALGLGVWQEWRAQSPSFAAEAETGGIHAVAAASRELPDGAIVVATWRDAAALAYGAYIDRVLGSRIVVSGWPGEFRTAYPAWASARRVFVLAGGDARSNAHDALPPAWLHERRSPLSGETWIEVIPRDAEAAR